MDKFNTDDLTQDEILSFALWMLDRQTDDEINSHSTIEDNGVGFNSSDAKKFSAGLLEIRDGTPFSDKEIRKFIEIIRPSLSKYKKQYSIYASRNRSNIPISKPVSNSREQKQGELGFLD